MVRTFVLEEQKGHLINVSDNYSWSHLGSEQIITCLGKSSNREARDSWWSQLKASRHSRICASWPTYWLLNFLPLTLTINSYRACIKIPCWNIDCFFSLTFPAKSLQLWLMNCFKFIEWHSSYNFYEVGNCTRLMFK